MGSPGARGRAVQVDAHLRADVASGGAPGAGLAALRARHLATVAIHRFICVIKQMIDYLYFVSLSNRRGLRAI